MEPPPVVKKFGPEAKEARKKKAEAEKRAAEQKHKQAEEDAAKKAKAKALYALNVLGMQCRIALFHPRMKTAL